MIRKKLIMIPAVIFFTFAAVVYLCFFMKASILSKYSMMYIFISIIFLGLLIAIEMYTVNKYVINKLKALADMFYRVNNYDLSENIPTKDIDEFTYLETLLNNTIYRFKNIILFMTEAAEWLCTSSSQLKNISIKSTKNTESLDDNIAEILNNLISIDNIVNDQCISLDIMIKRFVKEYCNDKSCENQIHGLLEEAHKVNSQLTDIIDYIRIMMLTSKEQKELAENVEDISKIVYRLSEKINCDYKRYKM